MVASQKASVSLFLWSSFISSYFIFFFYTQLTFVYHLLKDLYIVCNRILAFCFSLFQKDLNNFKELLFEAFLCSIDNIWLRIFRHFYIWEKDLIKKSFLKKLFKAINFYVANSKDDDFMNHLKITWKPLKSHLNYFKDNAS